MWCAPAKVDAESEVSDPADDLGLPANRFLAPLPWWVVVQSDTAGVRVRLDPHTRSIVPEARPVDGTGYLVLDAADGSTCLAVFTDEDLAERFIRATDFPGVPLAHSTPEHFLSLAQTLPAVCSHVAFDPPGQVGARARWVVSLRDVLEALRNVGDE